MIDQTGENERLEQEDNGSQNIFKNGESSDYGN